MKKRILLITLIGMSFGLKAQTSHLDGQTKLVNPTGRTLIIEKDDDDSWLTFHDPGQYWFSMGIDKSNSGSFSLNSGGSLNSSQFVMNSSGLIGIGTNNPVSLLDVNGDGKIGSLNSRHYLRIASKEWPEIRFQTPSSDRQIRLGIAHANNSGYGVSEGDFYVYTGTVGKMPLVVNKNGNVSLVNKSGNVGIGTNNPGSWKLAVNGKIRAKEIKVETGWSDFVFEKEYKLPTLIEVEKHIKVKGHLKDIPSAKEVEKNGIFLGEMDSKLLQKIEELTLYTIQQQKEIETLKTMNSKLIELQKRLEKLEKK